MTTFRIINVTSEAAAGLASFSFLFSTIITALTNFMAIKHGDTANVNAEIATDKNRKDTQSVHFQV